MQKLFARADDHKRLESLQRQTFRADANSRQRADVRHGPVSFEIAEDGLRGTVPFGGIGITGKKWKKLLRIKPRPDAESGASEIMGPPSVVVPDGNGHKQTAEVSQ